MSDEWDLAASSERATPICKDGVTIAGDLYASPAVGKRALHALPRLLERLLVHAHRRRLRLERYGEARMVALAREGDRAGEGGHRVETVEAAATELDTDVPTSLLQRLCHENGAQRLRPGEIARAAIQRAKFRGRPRGGAGPVALRGFQARDRALEALFRALPARGGLRDPQARLGHGLRPRVERLLEEGAGAKAG